VTWSDGNRCGEVTPKGRFASLFFGLFDFQRGSLEFVNAGHHYPFQVRSDGSLEDLVTGGTVLGLSYDSSYERGEVALEPGDLFVFYSDGVTDRGSTAGELSGIDASSRRRSGRDDGASPLRAIGDLRLVCGTLPRRMTLVVAKVR
jgi:sigma-B regulation protein RsbU (phosphoserine phosphatase)